MDEIKLYDSLPACLLTDWEMSQGIETWLDFDDPFTEWNIQLESPLAAMASL